MRISLFVAAVAACSLVSGTSATNTFFTSKRTEAPTRAPPSCETTCKDVRSPVCGTNGKTYDNYCLYSIAACKNKTLALAYTTVCKTPPKTSDDDDNDDNDDDGGNTEGDDDDDKDVSKGATQVPTTKLPVTTAAAASIVDHLAAAIDNANDDDDCGAFCTREYEPVCGSDRVLYANLCLFDAAKCRAHGNLYVRPKRECKA